MRLALFYIYFRLLLCVSIVLTTCFVNAMEGDIRIPPGYIKKSADQYVAKIVKKFPALVVGSSALPGKAGVEKALSIEVQNKELWEQNKLSKEWIESLNCTLNDLHRKNEYLLEENKRLVLLVCNKEPEILGDSVSNKYDRSQDDSSEETLSQVLEENNKLQVYIANLEKKLEEGNGKYTVTPDDFQDITQLYNDAILAGQGTQNENAILRKQYDKSQQTIIELRRQVLEQSQIIGDKALAEAYVNDDQKQCVVGRPNNDSALQSHYPPPTAPPPDVPIGSYYGDPDQRITLYDVNGDPYLVLPEHAFTK